MSEPPRHCRNGPRRTPTGASASCPGAQHCGGTKGTFVKTSAQKASSIFPEVARRAGRPPVRATVGNLPKLPSTGRSRIEASVLERNMDVACSIRRHCPRSCASQMEVGERRCAMKAPTTGSSWETFGDFSARTRASMDAMAGEGQILTATLWYHVETAAIEAHVVTRCTVTLC
jgi:hypothetical protein